MSKHTPGPWEFLADNGDSCGAIVARTGWVCDFLQDPSPSNARLIAAAPDLLEALKRLIPLAEDSTTHPELDLDILDARVAIAKATGGEV